MKVDSYYFESAAHIFSQKNPLFWKILRSFSDISDCIYVCETIVNNIANFSSVSMETISYCLELYENGTIEELGIVRKFYKDVHDRANYANIKANVLHDVLIHKIGNEFKTSIDSIPRIKCPYVKTVTNIYEEDHWLYCLRNFNNSVRRGHFYVMLYVFDLTLRMQKIKSEIIKYELSRNGQISGTIIDVLINENYVYYIALNKEFKIYNKAMKDFNYYGNNVGKVDGLGDIYCPNNNHLLYFYHNIAFDFNNNRNIEKGISKHRKRIR